MTKQVKTQIKVRFSVNGLEIKGTTIEAPEGFPMGKIVFVVGYEPKRANTWTGDLPKDRQVWLCEVVKITKQDRPDKGAVLVSLIEKTRPPYEVETSGLLAPNESEADRIAGPIMQYLNDAAAAGYISRKRVLQIVNAVSPATDGWSNVIKIKLTEGEKPKASFTKTSEFMLERDVWTIRVTFAQVSRPSPELVRDDLIETGEGSCVLETEHDFIPNPAFEYEALTQESVRGTHYVREVVGYRVINTPFINQILAIVAGGERVLENAVDTAKKALGWKTKEIWSGFWNYGCGWTREPDSFGIIPEGHITLKTPNGGAGSEKSIAGAIISAQILAVKYCDTVHRYRRNGEFDNNDNPCYHEEPVVEITRPEGGNWYIVIKTRWVQGTGYVTEEVHRVSCAEGLVRKEWD